MNSLDLLEVDPGTSDAALSSDSPIQKGLMVGMSTGKSGKHASGVIPLGTVRYMLAAEAMRAQHGAEGTLFIGHQREDIKPHVAAQHVGRITKLATALAPNLVTLQEEHLCEITRRLIAEDLDTRHLHLDLEGVDHGDYVHWQTKVVGTVLHQKKYDHRLKYGLEATVGHNAHDVRGERQFDRYLPADWRIQCLYGPADRDTNGNWAIPYLLDGKDKSTRICVPVQHNGIPAELNKIQPGIAAITLDTWAATAKVILQEEPPSMLHSPYLAADPLTREHLEQIRCLDRIDATKQLLQQALMRLVDITRAE
jgi:hypothetical protein